MNIELINTNERFILINNGNKDKSLNIDKHSVKASISVGVPKNNEKVLTRIENVKGIIGCIQLVSGHYLMIFKEHNHVATVTGKKIYQMKDVELIPFFPNQQSLVSIPDQDAEEQHLSMIRWLLSSENFYFSYDYDFTLTLQRQYSTTTTTTSGSSLGERCDSRFFWNEKYVTILSKEHGLGDWILPITMGFVESKTLGGTCQFTLISRRNLNRSGTRYNVRGIDKKGNVANNVETEQIIEIKENTFTSFVQVRGSIPLLWSQFPTLKYKPSVKFYGDEKENSQALEQHFKQLHQLYGSTTVVNLIDRKGAELKLGEAYEERVKSLKDVHYVWFDFHSICKGMRYDKLSILMDQLKDDLKQYGFFFVEDGKIVQKQQGVFRTNCIDNLDRTNVVQSLITRHSLENQMASVLNKQIPSTTFKGDQFEYVFKNIWADHGDAISTQYSGTGALKNDFTRTGKRNFQGVLRDGENSVKRYYLNNFKDGFRQDSYFLFTNPSVDLTTAKQHESKPPSPLIWIFSFVFAAIFLANLYLPSATSSIGGFISQTTVLVGSVFFALKLAMKYQASIVDKPTLFKLDSIYKN
ncbi:hypothetical protein DDB_G0271630 [Dictyostelium discoideum AX4]|uniref:Phosphatidylinositol-3-phosphatase SAC1 n=1 Tax=Dictyostelium discoideum TaxID=44689 RepID=SAC1_DICDI|nr:hypothetical protein DDB_G0271630 [Dictyostelium discoideum AX4]Q55AW9.1 RecName: Full=Phosphatidylinositol-3-phosphatase SAC1; AltName: Full=Phosphatidylinositol-4-phosphate phosphatase [Dictyostelium discoideum]EAL71679.1 hypothetical protein DDB_G0271630 [Dictyostelium discoideum AX4]|eukprot:XP_645577.1 hypothetical protein DDB_G0271630 [Dictyostelium discoideum AX4]